MNFTNGSNANTARPARYILVAIPLLLAAMPASAQWTAEAKLVPGDLVAGDGFGGAVEVSGDTAVVGAPFHDGVAANAGAAYVYVRSGTTWVQQAKLRAVDGQAGDRFGQAVAIDRDTVLVGAPYHADPKGAVYVFQRSGTTWSEQAKVMLTVSDPGRLGSQIALDGDTAAIGAYMAGQQDQFVYMYVRSGTTWSFQDGVGGGGFYDSFACDLDLDGDWLVVGVKLLDGMYENNVGGVYVYKREGSSWHYQADFVGPEIKNYRFGSHVAISGETILAGAGPGYMQTYVYVRSGSTWSVQQILNHPADDLDIDGSVALIGGENYPYSSSYIARVIWRSGTTWTHQHTLGNYGTSGSSALDGGTVVIGNPADGSAGANAGAAHVLSWRTGTGFCFGDPGSGTPCPCNNDNDGSVPGSGCDNGVFASGAKLSARGIPSVSSDSVVLYTTGLEPNNSGLYFQANNAVNGGAGITFGDGLRCAGGQLRRLQVRLSDSGGCSSTSLAIGSKGEVSAGDTRRYQCWYRTQSTPACGLGVNEFNLSNGYRIAWLP